MKITFKTESIIFSGGRPRVTPTITTAGKLVDGDGKVWVEVETRELPYTKVVATQYFTVQDLKTLGKIAEDIARDE